MKDEATITSLGSIIADESIKDRSYFKKIFDEVESKAKLDQAIIKAHAELTQTSQSEALKKLLAYSKHYFEPTAYEYPKNDVNELKSSTEHTIEVLTKWADKINDAVANKSPIGGFNRFIHRSVAALASKLNNIENLDVRKDHFQIASYKINNSFLEYNTIAQDVIKKAIAKISAEMGVTDAIINLKDETVSAPQSTGVSLPLEIENITNIIGNIYNNFDLENKTLEGVYVAQIKRAITALKNRLCLITQLNTRYSYLSVVRSSIEKYVKNFDENFIAIIAHDLSILKDEQAMNYRNNQYKTKVNLRNSTDNSKTHLKLNIKDAQQVFDDVESEMITQMKPARYQSWSKLCLAICLLTGRRIFEVCVTGDFKVINGHTMLMTGIAKQKNDEDRLNKSIEFKTFANANLILQAINTLRDLKDFSVFKNNSPKFNKSNGTRLRAALMPVKENQVPMICSPAITIKLIPKSMRQLYAAMLKYQIEKDQPNESDNLYDYELAKHLGHDAERDIQTVQSYKDIVIHD